MARLIYISLLYFLICSCASQNSETAADEAPLPDETVTINVDQLEAPPLGVPIEGLGPEVPSPTPELQDSLGPSGIQGVSTNADNSEMGPEDLFAELPQSPPPPTTEKPRITGGPLPPIPGCPDNEVELCVSPACPQERTCRNRNIFIPCRAGVPCALKCVCRFGYFRSDYGVCVTATQCGRGYPFNEPSVQPTFAVSPPGGNDSPVQVVDEPLPSPEQSPPPPEDKEGRRHPPPLPIKPDCLDPNEVARCLQRCPPERTCRNRNIQYKCPPTQDCRYYKCICKPGYFRNAIGQCITKAQCNYEEASPSDGPIEGSVRKVAPPAFLGPPIKVEDAASPPGGDGSTVQVVDEPLPSPGQVPPPPLGDVTIPPRPLPVLPDCYDPNEEVRCVQKCPPERTCRNRKALYRCPRIKDRCTYKCLCKPGYFRNAIGQCITKAQCKQCSKPHEYYSCGVACDNVCSTIKFANQTNCPIKNIRCNKRCYCEPGYARDVKGNCIPISKCPPSCGSRNEEYVRSRSCPPDTCLSLVAKFKCNSKEKLRYRCRCKSGYLRPKEGASCVPICQCPEMANSPDCVDLVLF